jgi:hypothetical protein
MSASENEKGSVQVRYSIRDLSLIGILASINGVVEIGLGTLLHAVQIPVTGSIMSFFNITIYLVGRKLVPRTGVVLAMGFITSMMKLLYSGGGKLIPVAAIFLEALIIELILDFFPFKKITACLSGIVVNLFILIYPIIAYSVIGGTFAFGNLERLLGSARSLIPLEGGVFIFLAIYVIAGFLTGAVSWHVASLSIRYYELYLGERKLLRQSIEPEHIQYISK